MWNLRGINVFWRFFTPENLMGMSSRKYESLLGRAFQGLFTGNAPRIVIAVCVVITLYGIRKRELSPMMIAALFAVAVVFAYIGNILYALF